MVDNIVEQRGPFTVTKRQTVLNHYHMEVNLDDVIRPDGTPGEYSWINFPRQAVLVYPLGNNGNIYLAREFVYGRNAYKIEAAGGVIEEGESPVDAARRKAMVELGLEVESLRPLGPQATITSRVYNVTHSFLARIQEGSQPARPRSGDAISLAAFPFAEVMDMVRSRVINTAIIAADLWTINDLINRGRVSLRPTS